MIKQLENSDPQFDQGSCIMSNPHIGKDRRIAERRVNTSERRELVRFEINKEPRRSGNDRRKVNGWSELSSKYQIM